MSVQVKVLKLSDEEALNKLRRHKENQSNQQTPNHQYGSKSYLEMASDGIDMCPKFSKGERQQ